MFQKAEVWVSRIICQLNYLFRSLYDVDVVLKGEGWNKSCASNIWMCLVQMYMKQSEWRNWPYSEGRRSTEGPVEKYQDVSGSNERNGYSSWFISCYVWKWNLSNKDIRWMWYGSSRREMLEWGMRGQDSQHEIWLGERAAIQRWSVHGRAEEGRCARTIRDLILRHDT